MEIIKKREAGYNAEIEEQKSLKQKFEYELATVQTRLEKVVRIDAEKSKLMADFEDKYNRLLEEFNYQKNQYYNKETEYIVKL